MDYGQRIRSQVTMIDDLPELNDVEGGRIQGHMQGAMQGHMRGGHMGPPPRAAPGYQLAHNPHVGENLPPQLADKYRRLIRKSAPFHPSSGMTPYNQPPPNQNPHMVEQYEDGPPEMAQEMDPQVSNPALTGISCLDIANHVKDCPICSKFYNNDKTVYIIVIVVLAIICLLLLKKVLDV